MLKILTNNINMKDIFILFFIEYKIIIFRCYAHFVNIDIKNLMC